ncbi:MAG TPA: hotdog fold thioesterase [Nocardioides sp.]
MTTDDVGRGREQNGAMDSTDNAGSSSTPATPAAATPSIDDLMAAMPQGMGALNEKMGIRLVEVSPERIVATMPVEGNTQPYGLLHGGASVVLAETLGSIGSALHAHPDRAAVGVDINATHHRAATSGTVTAVATPAHLGRTSTSFEVVISNEAGKRICTARITCALIPVDRVPS